MAKTDDKAPETTPAAPAKPAVIQMDPATEEWLGHSEYGVYVHTTSREFQCVLMPGTPIPKTLPVDFEGRVVVTAKSFLPPGAKLPLGKIDLRDYARDATGGLDRCKLDKLCALMEARPQYEANCFGAASCFKRFNEWKKKWDRDAAKRADDERERMAEANSAPPPRLDLVPA